MSYIVDYEVCAFVFLLVITILFFTRYRFPDIQNKFFSNFIIAALVVVGTDILSVFTLQNSHRVPLWINYAVNIVLYGCNTMLVPILILYILALSGKLVKRNIPWITAMLLPAAITEVLILSTPYTHWFFYFTQDFTYTKGIGFLYLFVLSFFYFMVCFVLACVVKKKLLKSQFYSFMCSIIIVLASIVIQILFPGYLVTGVAISISILIMFITLQNPASRIDEQTGLFNKIAFLSFIKQQILKQKRINIVYIDIDKMSAINTMFGFECGNKLIENISSFLKKNMQKSLVFRIQGDQFLLVCKNRETCKNNVYKFLDKLSVPFQINNAQVKISACVCFAMDLENTSTDETRIIMELEQMMNVAKEKGSDTILQLDEKVQAEMKRKSQVENALQYSIKTNNIDVYLQPIYCIKTQKIVGAEALARMYSTSLGNISPGEFIPIAERTGAIINLGEQVQKKVCQFVKENKLYKNDVFKFIEVNLSALEFMQPNLFKIAIDKFNKYSVPYDFIVFEITESVATHGYNNITETMEQFNSKGVCFALDDFGTGFSNLSSIMRLPFSTVKIDRGMMLDALKNKENEFLLKNLINIFHGLGKKVIVEGVETEEQLKVIVDMNADYIQGFIFGKPMQMPQFLQLINQQNSKQI